MHSLEVFDETFDPSLSAGYDLLVVPSIRGVDVAVHDAMRAQFLAHISEPVLTSSHDMWANTFSHMLQRLPWLNAPFHSVRLGWRAELFTVVPEEFFAEEHAKSLLSVLAPFRLLDTVYYNRLPGGAVLPFAVPCELLDAARSVQPKFSVIHPDASLLLLAHSLFKKGNGLLVHLDGAFATLILLLQGDLNAALGVRIGSAEDLLYRILALFEAQRIDPALAPFLLVGAGIESDPSPLQKGCVITASEVLTLLSRYLPAMEIRLQVPTHPFSYLIEKTKENHLALFSMILCE